MVSGHVDYFTSTTSTLFCPVVNQPILLPTPSVCLPQYCVIVWVVSRKRMGKHFDTEKMIPGNQLLSKHV
jgi:hypothetical protein